MLAEQKNGFKRSNLYSFKYKNATLWNKCKTEKKIKEENR